MTYYQKNKERLREYHRNYARKRKKPEDPVLKKYQENEERKELLNKYFSNDNL